MRLTRVGSKKNPIYRVVVADSRSPRDGKFIEIVGRYNPQTRPVADRVRRGEGEGLALQGRAALGRGLAAAQGQEHRLMTPRGRARRVPGAQAGREAGRGARRGGRRGRRPRHPAARRARGPRPRDRPRRPDRPGAAHGRPRVRRARRPRASCSRSSSDATFVTVGRVGRPHGLDGSFVVERPSENEQLFEPGATLYVGGEPVDGRRAEARRRPPRGQARPAGRARARSWPSRARQLPEPEADSYYVFQLVGLEVVEEGGRRLGAVQEVAPGSRERRARARLGPRAADARGVRPRGRPRGGHGSSSPPDSPTGNLDRAPCADRRLHPGSARLRAG